MAAVTSSSPSPASAKPAPMLPVRNRQVLDRQAQAPMLPVRNRQIRVGPPLLPVAALYRNTSACLGASGSQSASSKTGKRATSPSTRRASDTTSTGTLPTLLTGSSSSFWQGKSPLSCGSDGSKGFGAGLTPASNASETPQTTWQPSKVRWCSPLISCRSVKPYEELYGRHPSLFNFDASGRMVPPSPCGYSPTSPEESPTEAGASGTTTTTSGGSSQAEECAIFPQPCLRRGVGLHGRPTTPAGPVRPPMPEEDSDVEASPVPSPADAQSETAEAVKVQAPQAGSRPKPAPLTFLSQPE